MIVDPALPSANPEAVVGIKRQRRDRLGNGVDRLPALAVIAGQGAGAVTAANPEVAALGVESNSTDRGRKGGRERLPCLSSQRC